jgi:hypothetical protein
VGQSFTDSAGRKWDVAVTAADLTACREEAGVALGRLPLDKLAEELADAEKLVAVLFVLVKDQIAKLGLTPEQFARGLDGDALEAATVAFWRAWADFSPRQTRRLVLGLVDKTLEDQRAAVDKAMEFLTSSGSAGSLEVPPGATPDPTASGR